MITGKNIILRSIETEDAVHTYKIRKDMTAVKSLLGYIYPVNFENENEWIKKIYSCNTKDYIYLAIEIRKTKKFAGYISIKNINHINKTADFGIVMLKEYRGKGYAKESIIEFLKYLLNDIGLRKIKLLVLEENGKAIRLYKNIGFVQEGILKDEIWQDGKYKNVIIMSLFLRK